MWHKLRLVEFTASKAAAAECEYYIALNPDLDPDSPEG
jgi:hypothetical protein